MFSKNSQACDWLAKWLIMLGFMDLRWPRVVRHSNVGLLYFGGTIGAQWAVNSAIGTGFYRLLSVLAKLYTCLNFICQHSAIAETTAESCGFIGISAIFSMIDTREIIEACWHEHESAMQIRVHSGNRSVFRRSQIMRLCYFMPFLFIYSHKKTYHREILDQNIETEMYFYCWSVLSDCAISVLEYHVVWLQSNTGDRPWEMIWKNILYLWFSHFTLTEAHQC